MLEGNMNTDTTENWLPDFLDEVGLPQHAVFRGYVLYNDEQERFLAINTLAPERARSHYVESCAWAHRYPLIRMASDALRSHDTMLEIRALFELGRRYLTVPV
ncbi:hypothetical protein Q670_06170 [Alcanivorax sp. P2S70]|uniref:Uncharacterized protein n=2 Tax=Alcanivoracaceae TaxID=224372 RepID=A0A418XXF0_9GAMM|nr:hypothetical protein Q670_06170 [Alcanivorax sp. P2S70]RJG17509.1 hypothetical protein D4A39_12435 [Alcanivorax profundi]|tara:strand:- start:91 stop:399 length:309 start_codon:yes stop_codon:yes gene_type:complete